MFDRSTCITYFYSKLNFFKPLILKKSLQLKRNQKSNCFISYLIFIFLKRFYLLFKKNSPEVHVCNALGSELTNNFTFINI